jgi:hypothetical protein
MAKKELESSKIFQIFRNSQTEVHFSKGQKILFSVYELSE